MSKCVVGFVALVLGAQFAGADVLNPSFENTARGLYLSGQSLDGWIVGMGDVEIVNDWQAAEGTRSVDLNGNYQGSVYQEIPTSAGHVYTLRFAMAGNPDEYGEPLKTMQLSWASGDFMLSELLTFDTTGRTFQNMGWTYHEYVVQAGGDTAILTFESLVTSLYYGPAIDDVSLVPMDTTGDLNCDGSVNFRDINPFVLALANWGAYLQAYPNCDIYLADINADGYVSFADINPFVALLSGN